MSGAGEIEQATVGTLTFIMTATYDLNYIVKSKILQENNHSEPFQIENEPPQRMVLADTGGYYTFYHVFIL